MKTRVLTLLVVLVLMVGLVPVVGAQGDDFFTCFDLPAEDCEILMASEAADMPGSFNMAVAMDMALAGLAAMGEGAGDLSVQIEGGGPIVFDETLSTFPPMSMQFDYTLNAVVGGETETISQSVVMVDGVFYVSDPESGEWMGMAFADLMASSGFGEIFGEGFLGEGGLPEGLPEGALSPEDLFGGNMAEMMGLGEDVMALLQTPGFIHMERLPDEDMMGQTMHVFNLTVDSGPLFASQDFLSAVSDLVSAAAAEDPSAAQMGMMLPMLISGTSIVLNQTTWIGANDLYTHSVTMDLNVVVDLGAMMPPSSSQGGQQLEPITFDLHLDVQMDQFNEAFEITAPEGATMISPEMMGMGASSGG